MRINEQRLRDDQPLVVVIPLVLYHGPEAWNVPRSLEELIAAPPPFDAYVPQLRLELLDLSQRTDEDLRGEAVLHASLLMLKYIRRPELRERLPGIMQVMAKLLVEPNGRQCVLIMLNYLATGTDRLEPQELDQAVADHLQDQKGDSLMPTIAEQWIQEGMEKGMEKGQIRRIHLCERLLNRPLTPQDELSRLSPAELEQLADKLQTIVLSK